MTRSAPSGVAVIGAGAWGTALALILASRGQAVRLWEFFPEYAQLLKTRRENPKFLPGIVIPETIEITSDLEAAVSGCATWVFATPAQRLRSVLQRLRTLHPRPELIVTAAKGIETHTLARMSEIVRAELGPGPQVVTLSGPSHAEEVGRCQPSTVVAASDSLEAAQAVQSLFMTERFRVYVSTDQVGVELGGALKNVIALAAGIVDGLGLGDNTKAALQTRGLAEIARLGRAAGAHPQTFAGLSGMGDLIVTCNSRHSRNRRVGEALGRGETLDAVLARMEMVAEGVETARSARQLALRLGVEMPIVEQVNRVLFEQVPAAEALKALMQRPGRPELDADGLWAENGERACR